MEGVNGEGEERGAHDKLIRVMVKPSSNIKLLGVGFVIACHKDAEIRWMWTKYFLDFHDGARQSQSIVPESAIRTLALLSLSGKRRVFDWKESSGSHIVEVRV